MSVYPEMIPVSVGSWYNPHKGAGAPSADLGGVGDTYLDTTNNVYYVKTNSGWMDTKGSSTLPAVTSADNGFGIIADNGTWAKKLAPDIVANFKNYPTASSSGTYYVAVNIAKRITTVSNNASQWSADFVISCDANVTYSGKIHCMLALQGTVASGNVAWHSSCISTCTVSSIPVGRFCNLVSSYDKSVFEGVTSRLGKEVLITPYIRNDGELFLLLECSNLPVTNIRRAPMITLKNIVCDEHWTWHGGIQSPDSSTEIPNNIGNPIPSSVNVAGNVFKCGVFYRTDVPVPTAANQMLVSDGNGGWTTENTDLSIVEELASYKTIGCYPSAPSSQKRYLYFPIGHKVHLGQTAWHIQGIIYIAQHARCATMGIVNITGNASTTSGIINAQMTLTLTSADLFNNQSRINLKNWFSCKVVTKQNGTDDYIIGLVFDFNNSGSRTPRIQLMNVVTDQDILPSWGVTTNNGTDEVDSSWTVWDTFRMQTTVPVPTTADAGKVLKVDVSGFPSWLTP